MKRSALPVFVIGGGLTGLTAAFRLAQRDRAVVLVEREPRLGGQIHTHVEDGVTIELGAEGFVARSACVPALARDLGIEAELLDQATTLTFALVEGALVPLAPGEAATLLGFQVPKEELGRGIRSMARGMGQLTDRLAASLEATSLEGRVELLRGDAAKAIEAAGSDLRVALTSGVWREAAGVVVATPAAVAADLLEPLAGEAARGLATGSRLSNASVSLRYDRAQIANELAGSGFIVPAGTKLEGVRACSFVTTKFERPMPDGTVVLRVFFRPSDEELATRDDAAWIATATRAVGPVLGITGAPIAAWASVWPLALPVYDEAYRNLVASAERSLAPYPVALAGSHFHGAGIDAAVASAERAAETLATRAR